MNFSNKLSMVINVIMIMLSLLMYVGLDGGFTVDRFLAIGGAESSTLSFSVLIRKAIFIFEYICAFSILIMLTYYHNWKGFVWLGCLSFLFFMDSCCFVVYGRPADIFNISMLIDSAANIKEAIGMYFSVIFKEGILTILCFLPLVVSIYLNRVNGNRIRGGGIVVLTIILFFIYFITVVFRGGTVTIGFPKGFSFLFGCVTSEFNKVTSKEEYANVINFDMPIDIKNVVFIIDESISYDEISGKIEKINTDNKIFNFGKTISAANCSATSNYILRKGVQEKVSGKFRLLETNSVFEIAKQNKYHTYYIDAQGVLKDNNVRNYFTDHEIGYIDKTIDLSSMPLIDRDRAIPDIVQGLNRDDDNKFIFINKVGAHFPYKSHLPAHDITNNNMDNYRKVLDRNVIYVVKQLIDNIDDKTVIFYTSDHGQNFDGGATHCNSGSSIRKEEYYVPFFIITSNKYVIDRIKAVNNIKSNHFFITESVRNLLGGEVVGVPSLFKDRKKTDNNMSICGIWGQPIKFFGKEPYCINVD